MPNIAPNSISYTLLEKDRAMLDAPVAFSTPIKGYDFVHFGDSRKAQMRPNGTLIVSKGFVWDFASGPAIDTPEVVIASLAHDCLIWVIEGGKLPKKFRKKADKIYRNILKEKQVWWFRRWYHYLAVRLYSLYRGYKT